MCRSKITFLAPVKTRITATNRQAFSRNYSSLLIQRRPISICIFRHLRNRDVVSAVEVVVPTKEMKRLSLAARNSRLKTLVVFYSRTGITRKAAETIARALSGDIEEIVAKDDRSDFSGYGLSREEAVLKKPALIKAAKKDPARYDLTIIGTPVWVQTVSSPMRAYILRKSKRHSCRVLLHPGSLRGGERVRRDARTVQGNSGCHRRNSAQRRGRQLVRYEDRKLSGTYRQSGHGLLRLASAAHSCSQAPAAAFTRTCAE